MHGAVLDYIVLSTVVGGNDYNSGDSPNQFTSIKDWWGESLIFDGLQKPKVQPKFKKILDVGALDINGSMRRYDFLGFGPKWTTLVQDEPDYTGVDLIPGLNVDVVANGHDLPFKDNLFDLVMCLETLEHDDDPGATIAECWRCVAPGGWFLMTCANWLRAEHGTEASHPDLGGGSRHYTKITPQMMELYLDHAGVKEYTLRTIESDFQLKAVKPL